MSSIIYIISFPFHKNFIGGLIYSASCAAMIGGLADWWGINKLLSKTITNNKQKIYDSLAYMVSDELLTKENIKLLLSKYDTSKLVIELIKKNDEFDAMKLVLEEIIKEDISNANTEELKEITLAIIIKYLKAFDLHSLIIKICEKILNTEYEEKLINFILHELQMFIKSDNFRKIFIRCIEDIQNSYEDGSRIKKIIDKDIIKDIKLNGQSQIIKLLKDMENKEDKNKIALEEFIEINFYKIKVNKKFELITEELKIQIIESNSFKKYTNNLFEDVNEKMFSKGGLFDFLSIIIKNKFNELIFDINNNEETQKKLDTILKKNINRLIDEVHKNIGMMIKENLNKYTDSVLIDLIKSKVGDDLQLIRINGSLIGGIVGIIIFIIKYIIGV